MLAYSISSSAIKSNIFIPKYYDPNLKSKIMGLSETHELLVIGNLIDNKIISVQTGHEIGKMAYGTGNIPFVRTSDITNWEIKTIPKQGVSEEIYQLYAEKEDVQAGDILLVRDGTYLVGTSCIITESDKKILYCGGLIKIRINNMDLINPYLFLGLLNSYIVKRQIRTKQFTRDVIDTLGQRFKEVIIPVPKSKKLRSAITEIICAIVNNRIEGRNVITELSSDMSR